MIAKLLVLALCAGVALAKAQADKYPAGLNPHLCPNYPHCDNVLLAHAQNAAAGHYGYSAYAPVAHASHQLPAGVHPASCPNYPFCHNHAGAGHYQGYHGAAAYVAPVAYAYGGAHHAAAKYPAGVSPHTCPNYPYCH